LLLPLVPRRPCFVPSSFRQQHHTIYNRENEEKDKNKDMKEIGETACLEATLGNVTPTVRRGACAKLPVSVELAARK